MVSIYTMVSFAEDQGRRIIYKIWKSGLSMEENGRRAVMRTYFWCFFYILEENITFYDLYLSILGKDCSMDPSLLKTKIKNKKQT